MPKKPKPTRKVGRPPAGEREGERVTDYPQVSVRLPAKTRAKLQALSVITAQPQWRLIIESLECYLRDLPAGTKLKVAGMVTRSRRARGRRKRAGRA